MHHLDEREAALVAIVERHSGRISAEDPLIEEFSDDRGTKTDTFNRLFDRGILAQVQVMDDDFMIVFGTEWRQKKSS